MLPPLLLLCFFFTATAAAALLFLRRRAVATGSSSSLLRLLLLLLHRCCCWFTMTVIDINLYYGGLLSNANANKGLPFEGPGIKCYYTQIDHRLKTLNDLKMIVMKELHVNPALHDIQIIFRSPHEVLKHQINYQYMAIEADKHVKIMFDKIERIAQVSAIELYIKLELRAKVGAEEIQQTTTSLQVTVPDAQYKSLTHVKDDDDDKDYVDDTTINGEDFVDRDEYEERIDRGDFEIDINNHEIATNVHANDIFDYGEPNADNAISVQNIMNTIPAYILPVLSFFANTRANMERRTIVQIPSMASLNNEGASPSSSTHQWNYDVFLSFRGEDTRKGFTSHLYKALCHKGIYTFIDDKLPRGEEISEELIQAIKNSSILVIVFSENYVESKWCLDELAEIVKCRENDQEVKIRPVFYNVDPSEIRNQKGNFGIALANHEKMFENNKDKVRRWRDALRKVANASGWHYKKRLSMHDLIQQMGKEVVRQQTPDILEKRSRLCCYKDSLEVLIGNKGSEKIRGIMLHSLQPVKVQLHTEAFKKMENLKFLIVENVHICEPLEFLPHSLIFLKWPNYPFNLPSEYIPKKLVAIEMPHSHIRLPKLIKHV